VVPDDVSDVEVEVEPTLPPLWLVFIMMTAKRTRTTTARIAMMATTRLLPPSSLEVVTISAIDPPSRVAPTLPRGA
jgi:hypothetical protein